MMPSNEANRWDADHVGCGDGRLHGRNAMDWDCHLRCPDARPCDHATDRSGIVVVEVPKIVAVAGAAPANDNAAMPRELFRFAPAVSVADWSAVDDAVMGGVSRSRMRHDPAGHAVFEGIVSMEYGGGFASVRSRPMDLGFPGAVSYVLDARGDGKRYKLNLRTDDAFDGVNYQAAFEAPAGTWTRVPLPLSEFHPTFRGRSVPGAVPLDSARVRQIGLMIADRQAGSFVLALRSIRVE
jgi:NADH dehydrogenase [ubiquinone] 1 alpha subcomplex assembly factor 1